MPGREVQHPAPEHAAAGAAAGVLVEWQGGADLVAALGHALRLVGADFLGIRVGERGEVPEHVAEHRVLAADRCIEPARAVAVALVGRPDIPERADERVELRLVGAGEIPGGGDVGGQGARTGAIAEPVAAHGRCLGDVLPGHGGVEAGGDADVDLAAGGELLGLQVDAGAAEVAGLVGSEGLGGGDALEQVGREEVERHHLPVGLGAGNHRAVQGRGGVALTQAAHDHVLAVLHRHAAHPLHRRAGIAVGRLLDLLGADRVDHADRVLLGFERGVDRALLRLGGHRDFLQLHHRCRRARCSARPRPSR